MTGIRIVPAGAPLRVGAIPPGIQVAQSGSAASPLLTDLVAYWKLDETSGTRFDSVGTNNLSDNNTVGSGIGKVGNAASFVAANNEYLSRPMVPGLQLFGDLSVSCWVKLDASAPVNDFYGLVSSDTNPSDRGFRLEWDRPGGKPRLIVFDDTGSVFAIALWSTALNADTWYHVIAWYDSTAGTVNITVNNGPPVSVNGSGVVETAATTFYVGYRNSIPMWGLIDEVGIWKRILTAAERTQLYNGGAAITYPFS
jgi:hypothetical protein